MRYPNRKIRRAVRRKRYAASRYYATRHCDRLVKWKLG
jgi:hypothetical protein